MAKKIITIILVETPNAKLVIENQLAKLLPEVEFNIQYEEKLDLTNVPKMQIGYEYVAYAENILQDLGEPINALIITKHPLNTGKRINHLSNDSRFFGSSILTLKDLNDVNYLKSAAPLIYYFIVQFLGNSIEELEHKSDCIGSAQQSYEQTPPLNTCENCRLPDNEPNEYYEETMARIYGKIEKFPKNHHIILTHGIRTFGSWMYEVKEKLEFFGYEVTISGYNRFSTRKLLSYVVGDAGKKARARLKNDISFIQRNYPHSKISVIAHSHGTLLISSLIEKGEISIDRLVLVGSIVKRDYPWKEYLDSGLVSQVLNDAACRDIFSGLAENWVRGAGGSGVVGFQNESTDVRTIFSEKSGHSSSLKSQKHQERLWLPFIDRGEYSKITASSENYVNTNNSKLGKLFFEWITPKYCIIFILAALLIKYML